MMTDSEALAFTLPMARNVWGVVLSRMHMARDRAAQPESAFNAMATAMAALYKLGYDIGRAEGRLEAMADGGAAAEGRVPEV